MNNQNELRVKIEKKINPYESEIVHYSKHDVSVVCDRILALIKDMGFNEAIDQVKKLLEEV